MDRGRGQCTFVRLPPYFGRRFAHPQECQLPLAFASAAGCLKAAGHAVTVEDQWAQETGRADLVRRLCALDSDLIVFQVDSTTHAAICDVAWALRTARGLDVKMAALGQYADVFPERLLAPLGPFDVCIQGEPEWTLVEVVQRLSDGQSATDVAGTVWADRSNDGLIRNPDRCRIADLDTLPFPAYEEFDLDAYAKQSSFVPVLGPVRWGWILSSRGCPFGCLFCSPTLRKSAGTAWRSHSPRYIGDLAEHLVRDLKCNALAFEDDVLTMSRDRTIALCDELERRDLGVYWTAQTHLGTLDRDLVRRLARAGCRGLCVGVESGDEEVRARLKGGSLTGDHIREVVAELHAQGISLTLYFMIGSPGETLEQMQATLDFARELKPMTIQVAFFTAYPGSKAWSEFMVGTRHEPEMSHYNEFCVNLSGARRADVLRFHRRFYRQFYLDPRWMWSYARRRLPYVLAQNRGREWRLLARTLLFLLAPVRDRLPGEPP